MTRLWMVGLCILIGCPKRLTPPPEQKVALGGLEAPWRDYAGAKIDVCALADPAIFASDLEAMNALLTRFVDQTAGGLDGVWSEDQAKLLEDGQKQLPPALEATDRAVRASLRCRFDARLNVEATRRKTEDLLKLARARVADTELAQYARASAAILAWRDKQPEDQQSAREQWCPPKPRRGSPDIFYVFTDENGQTEHLFCDGSKVVANEGEKPQYVAPDSRKLPAKPYLDAAASYPQEDIQRAPRLPKKEQAAQNDDA